MLVLSDDSIVFILCSAGAVTGGPEALHQLCDKINNHGGRAVMIYVSYETQKIVPEAKTPTRYRHYNIRVSDKVVDEKKNILVVPELWPHLLMGYKNIQRCIWWLSVNYGRDKFKFSFEDNSIHHLYQSHYAKLFLLSNNAVNVYPLFDYLSIKQGSSFTKKDKIVLFNPGKGFEVTQRVIELCADMPIKFIALKGFARPELIRLFKSAMVYIDLGEHPGKDRIPREAACFGCIVITSKAGSATYFDDVPIKEEYKFNESDLVQIKEAIGHCMANFKKLSSDFSYYRRVIQNQEREFTIQVINLFCSGKRNIVSFLRAWLGVQIIKKTYFDNRERALNKLRKNIPSSIKSVLKGYGSK